MKVLIADDHEVYRAGLALLLRRQAAVSEVVEVAGFDGALDRLADEEYAIAFLDLNMPGMYGSRTLAHVRSEYPNTKVAIVSADYSSSIIDEMLQAGADLYLPKTLSLGEMASQIGRLIESCGNANSTDQIAASAEPAKEVLTRRQLDVLRCVAKGMTNKEIARNLGIAPGTVKIHLATLFDRFGAANRTELVILAKATIT